MSNFLEQKYCKLYLFSQKSIAWLTFLERDILLISFLEVINFLVIVIFPVIVNFS